MGSAQGNPIVDDRGATFVWRGEEPPPLVIGQWCDWDPERGLRPHRAGGEWLARLELPVDAYVEYQLVRDGAAVRDPLNLVTVDNGVGGRNHRFWMPRARRRALALAARRSAPRGEVTLGSVNLGWLAAPPRDRRLATYLPHRAIGDPALRGGLPLLMVLDGLDYLRRGRLARLLDALIADGAMAPVAAAFIDDAGPARVAEYAANDFTLSAIAELVVPAVIERLGLGAQLVRGGTGRAAILGSSLGGLMALHGGVRRPELFGRVIAQSSAGLVERLAIGEQVVPSVNSTLLALIEATPAPPIRVWLDVGELEGLAESNDRLAAILARRGFEIEYHRFPGGHDQTSWAESLVDALPAMFPRVGDC